MVHNAIEHSYSHNVYTLFKIRNKLYMIAQHAAFKWPFSTHCWSESYSVFIVNTMVHRSYLSKGAKNVSCSLDILSYQSNYLLFCKKIVSLFRKISNLVTLFFYCIVSNIFRRKLIYVFLHL